MITFVLPDADGGALPPLRGQVHIEGGRVEVRTPAATDDLHVLTEWALARHAELGSLRLARPSLEQVYLDVVDQAQQEAGHV
jgi:ABC-2 type transport system ATP-binding protein